MSDQGSRDFDASFLDRIAKPPNQQHPQEERQEERRRSFQDEDPRAVYFDQVRNGMYVRMALILFLLGLDKEAKA